MKFIRKLILKLLKISEFDIKIKHHYTNFYFLINTYAHKGYWFYGADREKNSIGLFKEWINKDDYVLEIGGHIGYFSTFYASLVGENGKVDVFEPSEKNIQYLNKSIDFLPEKLKKNISVIKKGAGNIDGSLDFFIDPITGQNNSFVENFEGFIENRKFSAEINAEMIKDKVMVIKLDTYFDSKTKFPDFVKIDVEGFEWNVIQGFEKTLSIKRPNLMIEIQADSEKIISYFLKNNYCIFNDKMEGIKNYSEYLDKKSPNIFFKYIIKN